MAGREPRARLRRATPWALVFFMRQRRLRGAPVRTIRRTCSYQTAHVGGKFTCSAERRPACGSGLGDITLSSLYFLECDVRNFDRTSTNQSPPWRLGRRPVSASLAGS